MLKGALCVFLNLTSNTALILCMSTVDCAIVASPIARLSGFPPPMSAFIAYVVLKQHPVVDSPAFSALFPASVFSLLYAALAWPPRSGACATIVRFAAFRAEIAGSPCTRFAGQSL